MSNTISNSDDIIDSRDVIERIAELESEIEEIKESVEDTDELTCDETDQIAELQAELDTLLALQEEAEGYASDWKYGEALIRDSHFKTYAQELAEDIGAIDSNAVWPLRCIDWDQAARELQMDYTCVSFDGVDYWVR